MLLQHLLIIHLQAPSEVAEQALLLDLLSHSDLLRLAQVRDAVVRELKSGEFNLYLLVVTNVKLYAS